MQNRSPLCNAKREGLENLITTTINPVPFQGAIRRLQSRFTSYAATCPAPLPAPGLIITPEIRIQSELYLPISEIAAVFKRFYQSALRYPPIFCSTPFHNPLSWADLFNTLAPSFQFSANPAHLLEALLTDCALRTKFLFASFLPRRFYGGFARYPKQQACIRSWLQQWNRKTVRCLDAACGTGEGTYTLARLIMESGCRAENIQIEGWTLEPLEVWAAAERHFPHDRNYERHFHEETDGIFELGYRPYIRFRTADLTNLHLRAMGSSQWDLILCNGLLGGPILHEAIKLQQVVTNLAALLAAGGNLLVTDSFHGGWKQMYPHKNLRVLFEQCGLECFEAGDGTGGLSCVMPGGHY
jgi:SAM-dependent methyltransferase